MDAPTIAQAKQATPESLWHFLAALPTTMEAQIFYALLLGGIVGMVAHYIRGRTNGDIAGSPLDYFVRDNTWRSIGAVGAVAAELVTEIGSGIFTTSAGAFVGWGVVILSGIKTGYLGDSLVNKGRRTIWTEDKRDAVATVKTEPDITPKPEKKP